MRIKFYSNENDVENYKKIEALEGAGTVNMNDVLRQTLSVELSNDLAYGETLWVIYKLDALTYSGEIPFMEENREYKTLIPAEILKHPGTWTLQLFIRLYESIESAEYITQLASDSFTFTVQNGLPLQDGSVVNNATIATLYGKATAAVQKTNEDAQAAQQAVTNITNIINTAKVGFSYDEANEELTLTVFTDTGA